MRECEWSHGYNRYETSLAKYTTPKRKITRQLQNAKLSNYYMSIKLSVLQYANIRKHVKKSLEYDMLAYASVVLDCAVFYVPTSTVQFNLLYFLQFSYVSVVPFFFFLSTIRPYSYG